MILRLLAAAALAAGATSLKAADSLPPFTVGYEPTTVDERGLWMDADTMERQIRDSKLTVHDEALNRYLTGVLCRTVGQERCRGVRVYVVEVPAFNASMSPNGMMMIWTGLLLRVQNEAELATILGHEFAHFELRHSLNGFKQRRSASDAGAWLAVLGGLASTNTGSLQTSIVGSMYKYSRDQEQSADLLGFRYLAAADYPTSAAPDVWKHVMAEQDATVIGRGRKPKPDYQDGFFNTHPASARRATYLDEEARKIGDSGRDAKAADLHAAIAPHLPEWLDAQIKLNDFGGTEYLLKQLASNSGWTGELLFARGELYRLRGNPRDLAASVEFYQSAITAGYNQPQVHRSLGMALLRTGKAGDGKLSLGEYLRLLPTANDAGAIRALMAN